MPSTHSYSSGELPAMYSPWGHMWLHSRLVLAGRTNPTVYQDPDNPDNIILSVAEANVSKNQLAFECQPPSGPLTADQPSFNVPPMGTHSVRISGQVGKLVKVRFDGIGFVSETQFTIPGPPGAIGSYDFFFGPCPASQRIVSPQMFDFYVEDGSCSPVAVSVTFS